MKNKKEMVIYSINNKKNGKKYIGSTIDFRRRKRTHLRLLRSGSHHSKKLQNSFNKHGEEAFEFIILEYVENVEKLIEIEQKWINRETPWLNMTLIAGIKTGLGRKVSEETKAKISKALTGKPLSEEHKKAMSEGLKGHKQSEETRKKRSETQKHSEIFKRAAESEERKNKTKQTRIKNGGYIVTEEMKKQISETLKSKDLQSAISLEIEKYDLDGVLIDTYPSMMKAEVANNISRSCLYYNLIKKGKKIYKGFIWKIKK